VLYIKEKVTPNEFILSSIQNEILLGSYHINRLKPGYIALGDGKYAKTIDEVRQAINQKLLPKHIPGYCNLETMETVKIITEQLDPASQTHSSNPDKEVAETQTTVAKNLNNELCATDSVKLYDPIVPSRPYLVTKPTHLIAKRIKWTLGKPLVLMQPPKLPNLSFWLDMSPYCCGADLLQMLLNHPAVHQVGSLAKFNKLIQL
jgi:hypothetical protein